MRGNIATICLQSGGAKEKWETTGNECLLIKSGDIRRENALARLEQRFGYRQFAHQLWIEMGEIYRNIAAHTVAKHGGGIDVEGTQQAGDIGGISFDGGRMVSLKARFTESWQIDEENRGVSQRTLSGPGPKCVDGRIAESVQHHQGAGHWPVTPGVSDRGIFNLVVMYRFNIHGVILTQNPGERLARVLVARVCVGTRGERRRTIVDRSNWSSDH